MNNYEIESITFRVISDIFGFQSYGTYRNINFKEGQIFDRSNAALLYNRIEDEFDIVLNPNEEKTIECTKDIVKIVKSKKWIRQ